MNSTMTKLYARYTDACRRAGLKAKPASFFANSKHIIQVINSLENLGATGEAFNDHEPLARTVHITQKLTKSDRARLRKAAKGTVQGVYEKRRWAAAPIPEDIAAKARVFTA